MNEIEEWKDSIDELEGITEEKLDEIKPEELNESLINALIATVNRLQKKIESFDRLAEEERQKVNANRKRLVEPLEIKIAKTKNLLELYMYKIYNGSGGKTKSYQGFYGSMGLRKLPDRVIIEDEDKLIEEIEKKCHPEDFDLIVKEQLSKSINKKELKKLIESQKQGFLKQVKIEQGELKFNVGE